MAESCSAAGLEVPILDDATRAQIDAHLPHYATSQNPVDGTAGSIRKIGYSVLGEWVAASPEVDTVIIVSSARNAKVFEAEKETMTRVARETLKPIVMCSYTMPGAAATRIINEAGFPLFMNMPNCARTVREMADYRTLRESFVKVPEINTRNTSREKATRDALHLHTQGNGALCEVEAADIFTAYDIDFGPGGLAATPEEAVSIASGIGGPVALKIQSPDILHKTDAGGVALNVEGEANIKTAFADILSNGKKFKPDAVIRGVLIRPMARSGVEMILGIKNDELFGPMLMVGLGGIFVEVLKDVVLLPVPLSQEDALAALRRLKGAAILNGVRGQKPADVDALAALMVRLSQFAVETSGDVAEAELNPVLIHPAGEGVSVVDALIVKT